ncbi:MAG: histidine kinase dimerization/phospho-acceptor domain-containing protein [Myxococcota bacterium]
MNPLGAVELRRSGFVRSFGLLAAGGFGGFAIVLFVQGYSDGSTLAAVAASLGLVGSALAVVGRARWGAWITMLGLGGVTSLASILEGGLVGPIVPYLAFMPLYGALSGGVRMGSFGLLLGLGAAATIGLVNTGSIQFGVTDIAASGFPRWMIVATVGGLGAWVAARLNRLDRDLDASRARAHASDLAKSRLLANCSHDLRTPLNAILGYTELLREDDELEPDAETDLATVAVAARQLLRRVNRVLELARIEAGRVAIRPVQVPLAEAIQRTGAQVAPSDFVDEVVEVDEAVLAQLVDALAESVDAGPTRIVAERHRPTAFRLVAEQALPSHRVEAADAVIAWDVCERLAVFLGGRAARDAVTAWVELPTTLTREPKSVTA